MNSKNKRVFTNDNDDPAAGAGAADLRRGRLRPSASIDAADEAADASSPIAMLPDELLLKIMRIVAKELPWDRRFKEAIDAAGGPLALFESVGWDAGVERWLEGRPGGVDAFLAERAPRLTGLRNVAYEGYPEVKHGARFLAALTCWPSLVSLRLISLSSDATGELRACLDALAAVPAGKLSLRSLEVHANYSSLLAGASREASALLGAIVRRCASSLRSLKIERIALEGRWEDLLPAPGLRELRLEMLPQFPPRPVALGGLERSGAAATLETLELSGAGDPLSGPEGPDAALALPALPALSRLTIDSPSSELNSFSLFLSEPNADSAPPVLPPPPEGSFSALRELRIGSFEGPSTRSDWWAAVLASPAGARLKSLLLSSVKGAGRLVESLQASGRPLALQSLDVFGSFLTRADAARVLGFAAGLPALHTLTLYFSRHEEARRSAVEPSRAPEGSFPALRHLSLSGPSTPCGWWAAALASPAGARLESLSLEKVPEAWNILAALQASGSPPALGRLSFHDCYVGGGGLARLSDVLAACPALRSLSFIRCPSGAEEAPLFAGLLAACPALRGLVVMGCDELEKFLRGGGDAEAAGPRLLRELKARGAGVYCGP
eukprot:tig00021257_g19765.t1